MKTYNKNNKVSQLKVLFVLTKASFLSSIRNPSMVFFNFFFPFIFIVIFGMMDTGNVKYDLALRSESIKTGPVYETIKKVDVLNIQEDKTDTTIDDALNKGNLAAALTIKEVPAVMNGTTLVSPPTYKLELERSTASPQSAEVIATIVDKVSSTINEAANPQSLKLVTMDTINVEGRKFSQIDFILPGQLAFALLSNALFGMSFGFIALKKELVLKRLFAAPIAKWTIMGSQVLSKAVLAIIQTLVIVLIGTFVFKFTLVNGFITLLQLIVMSLIGIFAFMSMGLCVAVFAKNEDSASPIANLIMMPQLFLAGAFFSIDVFPGPVQTIARILPMTFLNDAFKKIAFEGLPLTSVGTEILGIMVWGILLYILVIKFFKWE